MENEYKNIDRFDAYLKDTLSAEERFVFEKEMIENISFKKEFEQYKILVEGIQESRKQELKDYIKANKGKQEKGGFTIINSKWYAAAAVIVFFVAVYAVFRNEIDPGRKEYAIESPEQKEPVPDEILNDNRVMPQPPPVLKQSENPVVRDDNEVKDEPLSLQAVPLETEQAEYKLSPESLVEDIKMERLLASNSFPVLTYREYLKDQEPVANKMILQDTEETDKKNHAGAYEKKTESYSNKDKVEEAITEPAFIETEVYDSTLYKFHYLWMDSKKIKLYGVDKNAKIVFLHTLNKYAVLINGNGYEITMNKNVQPLKKTNLDIYLK